MKKTKKLKQNWLRLKPEIKEVWILSLPAILTQITTIVMQYIDSAMVGAFGSKCFRNDRPGCFQHLAF